MGNKNEYLPTKCWFDKDGTLHRAFYEYEEYLENPRSGWDCFLGVIVNASSYGLCGNSDEEVNDIEEWLISKTGINEDWYWNNHKRYGMNGLIKKFIKEQCIAFEYLSVYDHSGISVSCGKAYGWDYSNVGFIYVPKNSDEAKHYMRTHTRAETEKWAEEIIKGEIELLDDCCQGNVYVLVDEIYNEETGEWEDNDFLGQMYLTTSDRNKRYEMAIDEIKGNMSGQYELLDWDKVEDAINDNTLDVLKGQLLFDFMETA